MRNDLAKPVIPQPPHTREIQGAFSSEKVTSLKTNSLGCNTLLGLVEKPHKTGRPSALLKQPMNGYPNPFVGALLPGIFSG
jgi:hypothetical protein